MDRLFVRGTTVDAARRFMERHKGTPRWDSFIDRLEPAHRALIDQPVVRRRWYDLELYSSAVELAARELSPEDQTRFCSDLGRFVMDDGVNSLYRAFFAITTPSFVIKGSALLWGMFFKGSRLRVLRRGRKWVEPAIQGAARCWEPLCISISGGMSSALEHAGARNLRLTHHHCQSRGGSSCEFRFEWD
jgi:hypothetical protein